MRVAVLISITVLGGCAPAYVTLSQPLQAPCPRMDRVMVVAADDSEAQSIVVNHVIAAVGVSHYHNVVPDADLFRNMNKAGITFGEIWDQPARAHDLEVDYVVKVQVISWRQRPRQPGSPGCGEQEAELSVRYTAQSTTGIQPIYRAKLDTRITDCGLVGFQREHEARLHRGLPTAVIGRGAEFLMVGDRSRSFSIEDTDTSEKKATQKPAKDSGRPSAGTGRSQPAVDKTPRPPKSRGSVNEGQQAPPIPSPSQPTSPPKPPSAAKGHSAPRVADHKKEGVQSDGAHIPRLGPSRESPPRGLAKASSPKVEAGKTTPRAAVQKQDGWTQAFLDGLVRGLLGTVFEENNLDPNLFDQAARLSAQQFVIDIGPVKSDVRVPLVAEEFAARPSHDVFARVRSEIFLRRWAEAESLLNQRLAEYPSDFEGRYLLGVVQHGRNDYRAAAESYDQAWRDCQESGAVCQTLERVRGLSQYWVNIPVAPSAGPL